MTLGYGWPQRELVQKLEGRKERSAVYAGNRCAEALQPCFRPRSCAARRVGAGQPRDSTFSQLPRFLLLDSVSLGSGACAALWCMVPTYPSPMASGLKAARDRCEFRGDFMILVFLRGFQFSPALPSFLPDCQLCWLQAKHKIETTSSHHRVKSHLYMNGLLCVP